MNVHIIGSRQSAMRVVPRLARMLADANGWTLSQAPDNRADLNVFFPYLEYEPVKTPSLAWFTHKDTSQPLKVQLWESVARAVNGRVTSADLYVQDLAQYGPTFKAVAPLDPTFAPYVGEFMDRPQPHVGTSGFVYPGGRKGEAFLAKLAATRTGALCSWRAIGRGWPIPTQSLDWGKVPAWYADLDVYVSTSEIEGVGYGVLEALASGVPVVIPRGVGVYDEIEDAPGILRYDAGDLASAEKALEWAVALRVNTQLTRRLAETVKGRTPAAWGEDWRRAALGVLSPAPEKAVSVRTDYSGIEPCVLADRGVFIVAYGEPARKCARLCLAALRRTNPRLPVAVCSTEPLGGEDVFISHPDVDIGGRLAKVSIYDLAPAEWQYVCYLDADTEPIGDISPLFAWAADGWDLVICQNPNRFAVAAHMKRPDNQDECIETFRIWGTDQMMQWNGGVFCFARGERTAAFFAAWQSEWRQYGKRDQAALLRALWRYPLKLWALTNTWNEVDRYQAPTKYTAIVHHPMTARRWTGIVPERGDSKEAWAKVNR